MNHDIDPYLLADQLLGRCGMMLSASKTADPERKIVWNANVIAGFGERIKIWYGDISLTESNDALQELANKLDTTIFVLREMDARFENESNPKLENAVEIFEQIND